ncbi:ribokinase [Alicyclobacillus contaminans]|uniref:ribokinase n=1 Tax=Alicyclobacillus contaminans TaxID=392016 RepID=UPI0004253E42|nr:ribokinase [Alicyclobacillus contaminans]GMA51387.1 ribokinase [Alicyclobacillus contaminans]
MACALVVGSINMDVVNRVFAHPQPGETVAGLELAYHPGGKGANQAVAAVRSGSTVRMLAALGDDAFSETLRQHLDAEGVDISWVRTYPGPAGMAFITVDRHGENRIIVAGGANAKLQEADVETAVAGGVLTGVDTLLVQNEVPAAVTRSMMRAAKQAGVRVVFNPAPVAGVTHEWMRDVDVLVVNETEAAALTGMALPDIGRGAVAFVDIVDALLDSGAAAAIVTLGAAGLVYGTRAADALAVTHQPLPAGQVLVRDAALTLLHQPAFPMSVVDTTAAGDTFVGAFAAAYGSSGHLPEALQYAAAAAALAVTRPGAQSSVPNRAEVLAFLTTAGQRAACQGGN